MTATFKSGSLAISVDEKSLYCLKMQGLFSLIGLNCWTKKDIKCIFPNLCCIIDENNTLKGFDLGSRRLFFIKWNAEKKEVLVALTEYGQKELSKRAIEFQSLLFSYTFPSAILRGNKLAVVHGALLELADGRGILLSAESGVGKSTTSRRWEASGGKYTSDDMILLEYDTPEGVIAHPLPTWSRCLREGTENLCYPIQKKIPLAGLLVLSRAKGDEPERIVDMPWHEFLCQVYQSVCYFHINLIKRFPEVEQRQLIANNQACARKLCSLFPPRALRARLDGDLRETLKEFL